MVTDNQSSNILLISLLVFFKNFIEAAVRITNYRSLNLMVIICIYKIHVSTTELELRFEPSNFASRTALIFCEFIRKRGNLETALINTRNIVLSVKELQSTTSHNSFITWDSIIRDNPPRSTTSHNGTQPVEHDEKLTYSILLSMINEIIDKTESCKKHNLKLFRQDISDNLL